MVRGLASRLPQRERLLSDDLAGRGRTFSFEFMPPKDEAGERQLWKSLRELEPLRPTFVSVTYGAGGSTRERTIRVTEGIATHTTLRPVGHLTCVGHSRDELRAIIGQYADAGVRNLLALRGDPPGGPGQPWHAHPEGLNHAVELVELIRELGDFCVGVAAFPQVHPEAADGDADARILAAKARAGAEFAITQMFFEADDYFALVERLGRLGCDIPVIPGIMPITSLPQVSRMAAFSGRPLPGHVVERVERLADDPAAVRAAGVEIASELGDRLLAGGAPGLHFYTMNRSRATREIYANLSVTIG
jgi:methylenetetrahydrofolate reductase (NADPH)